MLSQNANVNNFATPTLRSAGAAVIAVSLNGDLGSTPAVPLPAAAPLLMGGLGVMAFLRTRRKPA